MTFWRKAKSWTITAALLTGIFPILAGTSVAQRDRDHYDHRNYYAGMRSHVADRRYDERYRRDDYEHRHDDGGIGPGKGAAIGAAGGAALGAIFGGGLKGALIGGAAGAGLGALGGKIAQDH